MRVLFRPTNHTC